MQVRMLTSSSAEYKYIDRFDDIIRLGSVLKSTYIFASSDSNKIYGLYDDLFCLGEIECPFPISNPVFLRLYNIDKKVVYDGYHSTYFYREDYPFILLPENRRGDMMNENISIRYPDLELSEHYLIDNMTGHALEDCFISFGVDNWYRYPYYMYQIHSYLNRLRYTSPPVEFTDMQDNEVVEEIMSNKISFGSKLLTLSCNGRNYKLYVFKSLFSSLNKSDKLSIIIRQDIRDSTKFIATFRVFKKKAKIEIPEISSLVIDSHACYLNF